MKTSNKHFSILRHQFWCPPQGLASLWLCRCSQTELWDSFCIQKSSQGGKIPVLCIAIALMLCQFWRGDKCKNISAIVDSHGLTKSEPTEEKHRLPHQPRFPKQCWHSKSRHLLLLISLEEALELTRVLNRLYFCRVGWVHKFSSLGK